ncbi:MAG: aldo/keto reductase [Tepidisphaera sp.]
MRYRPLGTSGLSVSEIGFGCWTMGGPNWSSANGQPIGWADVKEDEVLAGIKAGLDAGVNHWDNADVYGNGKAERLLGSCLKKLGVKPGSQVIATKVGHFRGTAPHAYEPRHIRNQCEQSLRNLGVETIDLYYFHHGTYVAPGYDGRDHDYLPEAAATMHALVKEGKVRAIGQSAYTDDDFERAVPVLKPHVLQNKANLRFSDFIRSGSRLQALMTKHQCSFVAFGPLDQGILLDKFDPDNPPKFDEGDYRTNRKDFAPATLRGIKEKMAKVRARFVPAGASADETIAILSSVASRWVLSHANVCSTIPGFRNAKQAACNLRAVQDSPMSAEDAAWLKDLFA